MGTPPLMNFFAASAHYGIACFMLVTFINQFDVLRPKPPIPGYDQGFLGFFLGAWTIGVFVLWGPVVMGGMKRFDDYPDAPPLPVGFLAAPSFALVQKHVFAVIGAGFLTYGGLSFAVADGVPPFGNTTSPATLLIADYANFFAGLSLFISFSLLCGSGDGTFGIWDLGLAAGAPTTMGKAFLFTMKLEGALFCLAGLSLGTFLFTAYGDVTGAILQIICAFGGLFFCMSAWGAPAFIISMRYALPCLAAEPAEQADMDKPAPVPHFDDPTREPSETSMSKKSSSKSSSKSEEKFDVELAAQTGSAARLSQTSAAKPLMSEDAAAEA